MEIVGWVREHPVAALVVACEVAFWVFLAAAVVARYVLRRRRLSTVLLLCEPLVEVVLLVATVADLLRGAEATWTHGLAALYLGFTVGFGRATVQRVDGWVAWRFFDGPRPPRVPSGGRERVLHEWRLWLGVLVSWCVAVAVLAVLLLLTDEPAQREVLLGWAGRATVVLGVWFVAGPVWQMFSDAASGDDDPMSGAGAVDAQPDGGAQTGATAVPVAAGPADAGPADAGPADADAVADGRDPGLASFPR